MDRRQRRQFLIAVSTLLVPAVTVAQRAERTRRIGFLSLDSADSGAAQHASKLFPAALERLGWKRGINLEIQWRWADGKPEALDALAADLVRNSPELIVARTNASIEAAKKATTSIPIVMFNASYPVETGLVDSMARPGGNVTGTAYVVPETTAKLLQLLKEAAPHTRRVAVPTSGTNKTRREQLLRKALEDAAVRLGLTLQYFEILSPGEITEAINRIAKSQSDGLLWTGDPVFRARGADFIAMARKSKIALVSGSPIDQASAKGGLISYAPDLSEFIEQTALYVDRILKGARPADLPVYQPSLYRLGVSLETARAIGIKVPQSVLVRADKVFE